MSALGHIEEVSSKKCHAIFDKPHYFLPHHVVMREESLTTKLYVVFNDTVPSTSEKSLNEILAIGPQLFNESFKILDRFRCYKYVLISDVAKLYRQISKIFRKVF